MFTFSLLLIILNIQISVGVHARVRVFLRVPPLSDRFYSSVLFLFLFLQSY